jgi:hypothetical protein
MTDNTGFIKDAVVGVTLIALIAFLPATLFGHGSTYDAIPLTEDAAQFNATQWHTQERVLT